MTESLWTREDVAAFLKVKVGTIDTLRHILPPPIYIGRLPRWIPDDVRAAVAKLRHENVSA